MTMPHRFVRSAPERSKHVHGELCFHTLTELDSEVAMAVAADVMDRLRKFGWDTEAIRVKVKHEDAASAAAQIAMQV